MKRIINNLFYSRELLMVVFRSVLVGLIVFLGILKLRILILWLGFPNTYNDRDILQEYLMGKALINGVNPYLTSSELVLKFIGVLPYYPHPAPYPPFVILLSIPLALINVNKFVTVWFIIELAFLAAIVSMLTILWKGRLDWIRAVFLFFILLAWDSVVSDLFWGQLSILITALLLAALLALKNNHKYLAGVIIGFTLAIKLITWPLVVYLLLKKDWRTAISSCLTALGLNLVALCVVGIGPFMDYYLRVSTQVIKVWHGYMVNFSLWSIGYRLFEGMGSPIMKDLFRVPPIINLPWVSPLVSIGLVVGFLLFGLVCAIRSIELETAFSILVCVIIVISPVSWDHYYVMIIIGVTVMLHNLIKLSFPPWRTLIFIITSFMLFLFNEQITNFTLLLNGGKELVEARGNPITFASSLLFWFPMVELIVLTILLWRSGANQKQTSNEDITVNPHEI